MRETAINVNRLDSDSTSQFIKLFHTHVSLRRTLAGQLGRIRRSLWKVHPVNEWWSHD